MAPWISVLTPVLLRAKAPAQRHSDCRPMARSLQVGHSVSAPVIRAMALRVWATAENSILTPLRNRELIQRILFRWLRCIQDAPYSSTVIFAHSISHLAME